MHRLRTPWTSVSVDSLNHQATLLWFIIYVQGLLNIAEPKEERYEDVSISFT